MRHIAGVMAFPGTKILSVALGPRFRGGDKKRSGGDKGGCEKVTDNVHELLIPIYQLTTSMFRFILKVIKYK